MFNQILPLDMEAQQLQLFLLGLFTGIVFMLLIFYILSIRKLNKQYENILAQFQYTKSQLMKSQYSQNPNPHQTQISITKEEVKENKSLLSILVEKALTTSKITLGGEITLDLGDEEIEIGGKKYKAKGSLSFNINQPTSQPNMTQFDESITIDEKEKTRRDAIKKLLQRK
jgi:hypothetical protein